MKTLIVLFASNEHAVFIVTAYLLLFAVIMGYVMVQDYRAYLDNHYKARYSLLDFVKREKYYVYLFLGLSAVMLGVLAVCLTLVPTFV